jgi:hypothetical protein
MVYNSIVILTAPWWAAQPSLHGIIFAGDCSLKQTERSMRACPQPALVYSPWRAVPRTPRSPCAGCPSVGAASRLRRLPLVSPKFALCTLQFAVFNFRLAVACPSLPAAAGRGSFVLCPYHAPMATHQQNQRSARTPRCASVRRKATKLNDLSATKCAVIHMRCSVALSARRLCQRNCGRCPPT